MSRGEKVTVKVQIEMDADELWSRIFGADPWTFGSWWRGVKYGQDTDWNKAGTVTVRLEDPDDEDKVVKKVLTITDLTDALGKCPPHIVSEIVEDNTDCISADYVIQVAVYGDCIYG